MHVTGKSRLKVFSVLKQHSAKTLIRSLYLPLIFLVVIWVHVHNRQLQYVVESYDELDDLYSTGDSRLLSVSTYIHDMVQFNSFGRHSVLIYLMDWNVSNFCRKSTDTEVSISESGCTIYPNTYEHWSYYLYPTSTISGTICSHYPTLRAYIIKGNNNFRSLEHASINEFIKYVEKNQIYDVLKCPHMANLNYIVNEEDYYHVMISNFGSSIEGKFDINLKFDRCQYRNISKPYCVATPYQSCEILLKFSYSGEHVKFLITTSVPSDGSHQNFGVVIQYHYRFSLFIVFFVIIFSLIELFIAFPQFRHYYTVSAIIFVVSFVVSFVCRETGIL